MGSFWLSFVGSFWFSFLREGVEGTVKGRVDILNYKVLKSSTKEGGKQRLHLPKKIRQNPPPPKK